MKNASRLMLLVILIAAQLVQTPVAFATVPARSAEAHSLRAASSRATASCGNPYVVKSGDTLSAIAARCGTTTYSLQQANGISGTLIRVGQQLFIPGSINTSISNRAPGQAAVTACPNPYTVRYGDTLSGIASRCGVTVTSLRQWNRLSSTVLYIGQRLITRGGANAVPYNSKPPQIQPYGTPPPPRWWTPPPGRPIMLPTPTPRMEPTIPP